METLTLSSTDNQNNQTLHVDATGGTFQTNQPTEGFIQQNLKYYKFL